MRGEHDISTLGALREGREPDRVNGLYRTKQGTHFTTSHMEGIDLALTTVAQSFSNVKSCTRAAMQKISEIAQFLGVFLRKSAQYITLSDFVVIFSSFLCFLAILLAQSFPTTILAATMVFFYKVCCVTTNVAISVLPESS